MKLVPIRGTRNWQLIEDFELETSIGNITIPKSQETDFASIPRIAWPIVAPTDPGVRAAALIHDYFYREKVSRLQNAGSLATKVTRKIADEIFYQELLDGNVPKWKARAMYYAVRLFGGGSWKE